MADSGVALAVNQIICSITAKRDWQGKVRTRAIVEKWRQEAAQQGADPVHFEAAVAELKGSAPGYLEQSGIAYRDGHMPSPLHAKLRERLDAILAKRPDIQPNTSGTVVNLIQPSLYPFVEGQSLLRASGLARPAPRRAAKPFQERRSEVRRRERFRHCVVGVEESSEQQWLPSEVDVDERGRARFASYINNAPDDVELYRAFEECFSLLLPLFEHVLTAPGSRRLVSLRGSRLQVIVKAAACVLQPGESHEGGWHVEGMQHERVVAAGLVYCGTSASMRGEGLAFRRLRNRNVVGWRRELPTQNLGGQDDYRDRSEPRLEYEVSDQGFFTTSGSAKTPEDVAGDFSDSDADADEDDEDDDMNTKTVPTGFVKPRYELTGQDTHRAALWNLSYKGESLPNHVELGTVATPQGRCLVFKNSLQHRLELLWNASDTEEAHRKVLIFWLVDPDHRILSTADVPRQQWDQQRARIGATLLRQWRPVQVGRLRRTSVELILSFAKWGFTHEEALQHRTALMQTRSYRKNAANAEFEKLIQREYSFCEH